MPNLGSIIMMSEEIFNDAAVDAGWDLEEQVAALLRYIDGQEDDESFRAFLEDDVATSDDYRSKHIDD